MRARRCVRLIAEVKQRYTNLEELRLELWQMPLWRYDLVSPITCRSLFPITKEDSKHSDAEALEKCMAKESCRDYHGAANACYEFKYRLTVFQGSMRMLARESWFTHTWQDLCLNYPQRIARLHSAQLEISKAASLIIDMDDKALEENMPALTELCKTLRDRVVGASLSSGGYTVTQWAADHMGRWTVWTEDFQLHRAMRSRWGEFQFFGIY